MLEKLYDYAINNEDIEAIPGVANRKVNAFVSLDSKGNFLGFEVVNKSVYMPDMGTMAQGVGVSNVLLEKAEVVLYKSHRKHSFFIKTLKEVSVYEDRFLPCIDILEDDENIETLQKEFVYSKLKKNEMIAFKVDGVDLTNNEKILKWWADFREKLKQERYCGTGMCFITGEEKEPIMTMPKVKYLADVGGRGTGDTLISFARESFQSYGFTKEKKIFNCMVSEEAMCVVNQGLSKLTSEAFSLGGTKFLSWINKGKTVQENEAFSLLFADAGDRSELFEKLFNPENSDKLKGYDYHIFYVSGASGRVMVRGYSEGKLKEMCDNIACWYKDLELFKCYGTQKSDYPNLFELVACLKTSNQISDMRNISPTVVKLVDSVISNKPIADSVARMLIQNIKLRLFSDELIPDYIACQFLKVWLIRKGRKEIMVQLNEDYQGIGYQLGRLFAVYSIIQNYANQDASNSFLAKSLSDVLSSPANTMGKLGEISAYKLEKIGSGYAIYYKKLLQDISLHIPMPLPKKLDTTAQSEFLIGYYQQCAKVYEKKEVDQ